MKNMQHGHDETRAQSPETTVNRTVAPSHGVPDFTCMAPLEIVQWLREHPSPSMPGGWGADPHLEMRQMRDLDAATIRPHDFGQLNPKLIPDDFNHLMDEMDVEDCPETFETRKNPLADISEKHA